MPPRLRLPHPLTCLLRNNAPKPPRLTPNRTLIAAPKPNSGPLMTRRSDRALPPLNTTRRTLLLTAPLFILIMTASMAAIFNYQKQSSSIVTSTLYSLRTNARARELLGDEVYFASQIPWIRGEMNQLHGRVDIRFWVKGTKGVAEMRFKSVRRQRMGFFETTEWSLTFEDGTFVNLLEDSNKDPFTQTPMEAEAYAKQIAA